jgi:hypothetical protein
MEPRSSVRDPSDLDSSLARWVAGGFISRAQADLIRADAAEVRPSTGDLPEAALAPARPAPTSFATEALAYVGGAMILLAILVISAIQWEHLSQPVRLALPGLAAIGLAVAGWLVADPDSPTRARLQGVLWLLSTASVTVVLALAGSQEFGWESDDVAGFTALGTAVYAAALWYRHHYPLQHAAFFLALATSAGHAAMQLPDGDASSAGLAIWGVGAIWMALAWGAVVVPRALGQSLGAGAALVGSQFAMTADWGHALGFATVVAVIALALMFHDLLLLGIGALGALETLPRIMARFFPGALAPPIALLGAGAILVVAALLMARRPRGPATRAHRARSTGTQTSAVALATGIALVVSVTVLIMGLG